MNRPIMIAFVLIKDNQVSSAETIEADEAAIQRRILKIQDEGFDSSVAIYGDRFRCDMRFPMSDVQIERIANKLFRSI